eukprot:2904007-Pyramimonas_sp.AAC.1
MPPWDTGEGEQTCAICAGELRGVVGVLGLCGHRFHKECLEQWRLSQPGVFKGGDNAMPVRCPYCRANDRGSIAALLPGHPAPERRRPHCS